MTTVQPAARRVASALAVAAVALSVITACGSDGKTLRAPTFPLPEPPATTAPASDQDESALLPLESGPLDPVITDAAASDPTVTDPDGSGRSTDGRITIDRLHSPANATAEMNGVGAVIGDPVSVDDQPGDVLTFDVLADGTFTMQVWIPDEGAHTVCVADACGRVYTLAPDADSPEEVVAKIDEALPLAADFLSYEQLFADWTVEIGGALSGTGGSTDAETKTVTIYRNRGRTVDEFVRTILHEFGHVADFERLDDADRARYLELRGLPAGMVWRDEDAHRLDEWGRQPSEDFAEVMVMFWTNGRYEPRTSLGVAPDPDTLFQIGRLAEFG